MRKIFLAEDDEYLSRVYERAFRAREYELTMAPDGEETLKVLSNPEYRPEAIILDLLLPKKNGEEILRAIKEDSRLKDIPVAILTNSFHKEDEERFLKLGANLFMIKIDNMPFDVVEKVSSLIHTPDSPQAVA